MGELSDARDLVRQRAAPGPTRQEGRTDMTKRRKLRELLAGQELIVVPGVYDGISATLVGKLGFPAAYMTGAGVCASGFGLPDIGLLTLTEMAERAAVLAGLLEVPLIADADTGYGSPINVIRTVREYEHAGVAAIQLEDQVFPKRCGHLAGKQVIPADEFARVLQAAIEARRDPDTVIIARTDARAPLGIEEAIRRAHRYAQLGADVIFVEAPRDVEEIEQIAAQVDAPLLLNIVPGGLTPELDHARLAELGYRIAIHPGVALAAIVTAAVQALSGLRERAPSLDAPASPEGFFDLFGLVTWDELGQRYSDDHDQQR
jgi:2-methylisocitrate lyase-like PEP mutase family enzyme